MLQDQSYFSEIGCIVFFFFFFGCLSWFLASCLHPFFCFCFCFSSKLITSEILCSDFFFFIKMRNRDLTILLGQTFAGCLEDFSTHWPNLRFENYLNYPC